MVRNVCRDVLFLSKKCCDACSDDLYIVSDLVDTLRANNDKCIGMAANMIGYNKRIICVSLGVLQLIMINPVITKKNGLYNTSEGCLSLIGERECSRYSSIEVLYYDVNFNKKSGKYDGLIAEVIQHEIDHLNGIII